MLAVYVASHHCHQQNGRRQIRQLDEIVVARMHAHYVQFLIGKETAASRSVGTRPSNTKIRQAETKCSIVVRSRC